MSMLAEPRRKKVWILNPRKSQWAEDDSKFGQKMLEQMGWSKGKGLGREMAGITEHIRPSVQNDSRGLGYEGRSDDWVAHLDDFNDLLASLQQGEKEGGSEPKDNTNIKSLEERSKKSRARVHYHKFTRGKDLSRYSSRDLASILGGRSEGGAVSQPVTPVSSRPPSPPAHADSEPASEAETEPAPAPTAELDTSSGYTTINTGLSVKDYFAAKMRKMKMLKIKHEQEQHGPVSSSQKAHEEVVEEARTEEVPENETTKLKKKKKKKRPASPSCEALSLPEEGIISEEPKKKKKRLASNAEEATSSVPERESVVPAEPKKKKKKRKTVDISPEESVETAAVAASPEPTSATAPSPGDDCQSPADASQQVPSDETGEGAPSKKKKRKKNKSKRAEDSG